jgi:hypothetical protein
MRLTDASVAIRPRNPWEAIDLGVLLAREHRSLLMTSWALVTIPVFILLSLLLGDHPTLAILLFWWLKPAFDRLPLLILSQALFGSTPSLKEALKAWPRTLKPQLLASLTWRRLSLSRSFILPVQQLENLSGLALNERIAVLSQQDLRAARSLTLAGSSLEMCLWIGLMVLFYALIPQQAQINWDWNSLLGIESTWSWLEHLTNAFYVLVLVIWEPIYVACGFTLYLNRRTALEAWDIELVLRRLRQRLIGSAYVLMMATGVAFATIAPPAWAADQASSCPIPASLNPPAPLDQQDPGPSSPRLTHQALSSEAAQQEINSLLQQPPFKNPKTISGWRFAEREPDAKSAHGKATPNDMLKWLNGLFALARGAAEVFKVLLWGAVIALAGLLIWRYRAWFGTFVSHDKGPRKVPRAAPDQLFGLKVSPQSLPDDVAGSVEQLWSSQPREALGLLYRALLSRLLSDYQLPLKNADTEGQVLERVARLNQPQLDAFSRSLTGHWQNLAYGHQLPPDESRQELCDGWRRLFDAGASQ